MEEIKINVSTKVWVCTILAIVAVYAVFIGISYYVRGMNSALDMLFLLIIVGIPLRNLRKRTLKDSPRNLQSAEPTHQQIAKMAACVLLCNEKLAEQQEIIYFCTVRTTEMIVEPFKKVRK